MPCVVCKKPITTFDWCEITSEFSELFAQADALGMESLTEEQQILVNREVHVGECYDSLA
jgi:hypothetical protein